MIPCPRTFNNPSEMIAIQSAFSMICLTFTWTVLNSAFRKLCRVLIQYTMPVSIRGEPVEYTAQARHSSAFLWLRSSIESKKTPGGPWSLAINKVSVSSFSPWIEVEGLLSRDCLLWALRELYALGQMILHLCCILHIWFCTVYAAFPSTLAAVKCLHTSDSVGGIFL